MLIGKYHILDKMAQTSDQNKTIAKNTFYLYLRLIVSMAISLYTSRAILEALGVEDYGIYNIVAGFVSMLSFFTSALTSAAQRFITYELGTGNSDKLKRTFSTFTTLLLCFSVVIILLSFCVGNEIVKNVLNISQNRIPAAINVFYLSCIGFCINIIATPYIACITAHEKMNFYALACISESFLKLIIVFMLYVSTFDHLETYAVLIVVVALINRSLYGIYCNKRFMETKFRILIDIPILKEIYSFSVWVIFGCSAMIAKEQGVNMLINRFFDVTINAARGVSMQVFGILNQFANSIATAINPQITKSYASGDIQRAINLTFVLSKAQGIMLLFLAVPLFLEMNFILNLWLKNVPYYAVNFAKWVVVICVTSTLRETYIALYLATGKVRFLEIVGGFIILLNLPLSYIVLKMGAAPISTMMINVVLEICCMIACFGYMQKIVSFPAFSYYKNVIFPLAITAFIAYLFGTIILMEFENSFLRLFLVCIITTISIGLFSYIIVLNRKERILVIDMVRKKMRKT